MPYFSFAPFGFTPFGFTPFGFTPFGFTPFGFTPTPPAVFTFTPTPPAIFSFTPTVFSFVPYCIEANTPVRTTEGYIKAKDLRVGQKLISYEFDELPAKGSYDVELWTANSISNDKIVETNINAIKALEAGTTVMFNSKKDRRFSLEHMLLVKRDDKYTFMQAGVVRVGDILVYDIDDRMTDVVVESIGYLDEDTTVYDITVDPYDTFIAGDIIAHNKKGIFQGPTKRDK